MMKIDINNEDCFNAMENLESESIDCIITDPPYGMGFKSNYRKEKYDKIENDDNIDWLPLFLDKYDKDLTDIFRKEQYDKVTCFFEFFGLNSFAGNHIIESYNIVLFDIDIYKKGLLPAKQFVTLFRRLHIPYLLDERKANKEFTEAVRESKVNGITFEGVICKGYRGKLPIHFKIKTRALLDKLKNFCGDDAEKFKRLV